MNLTWVVVIVIVALAIWLAIAAIGLLRRVKRIRRRIKELKEAPLMKALVGIKPDLEKLSRAATEFQAQIVAFKTALTKVAASVNELRSVVFSADLADVERAWRGLIDVLN